MAANPAALAVQTNPARVAEEMEKCFDLKRRGLSVRAIAAATGIAKSVVQERITEACKALIAPNVVEVRALEMERLDVSLERVELQIMRLGNDPDIDKLCKLEMTKLRISESRRRLMGADAPAALDIRSDLVVRIETVDLVALQ